MALKIFGLAQNFDNVSKTEAPSTEAIVNFLANSLAKTGSNSITIGNYAIQWGTVHSTNLQIGSITFTKQYNTSDYFLCCFCTNSNGVFVLSADKTNTGISEIVLGQYTSEQSISYDFNWIAIGEINE